MSILESLTILTDVLNMALALFMAIFLSARASSNRLAFRAIWLGFALAFYYFISFTDHLNPIGASSELRTAAILVGIVSAQNLTFLLLPEKLQRDAQWIARGVFIGGIVAGFSLILAPASGSPTPIFVSPSNFRSPTSAIINLFYGLSAIAILYNLVLTFRAGYQPFYFRILPGCFLRHVCIRV